MPVCFIISPIGEAGSEIRRNADDLRDLIIKQALEPFGFEVIRGDHRSEAGQIDVDVIRAVQEADLCVADIGLPNPNVYYEFGRRDETGKPLILLKAKGTGDLPVDIATRRFIEYDLDSRRGLLDAITQLKNFVEPIVKRGFESNGTGASLSELAEVLKRIERKIDRLENKNPSGGGGTTPITPVDEDVNPVDLLKLAMRQRNIPMAEKAMDMLGYRMDKHRWLDNVVEQVAAIGSIRAGDIMIENAFEFMDNASTFKDKIDYLGCLVSNLNRTDREEENQELVEALCAALRAVSAHEPVAQQIQIYNQLNRLYHGIYASSDDEYWLNKAIDALKMALDISQDFGYLFYNLALCERDRNSGNDLQMAVVHALRCIELDGDKKDDDHLQLVCDLMHRTEDPRLSDFMAILESVNPVKAQLLRSRWHH